MSYPARAEGFVKYDKRILYQKGHTQTLCFESLIPCRVLDHSHTTLSIVLNLALSWKSASSMMVRNNYEMTRVWHLTASGGEAPLLEFREVRRTNSLSLFTSPLWLGMVILVKVPSMGQRDLFENYLLYTMVLIMYSCMLIICIIIVICWALLIYKIKISGFLLYQAVVI